MFSFYQQVSDPALLRVVYLPSKPEQNDPAKPTQNSFRSARSKKAASNFGQTQGPVFGQMWRKANQKK